MSVADKTSRKSLSADALFRMVRSDFDAIPDTRIRPRIAMGDALMAAFAMFSLKDPSLLAFQERCDDPNDNFRAIYGIASLPSDTQMRTILDPIDPADLHPLFGNVFRRLQRGKALEDFVYWDGHYLLSLDGTGYFSSSTIHCPSCLQKHHRGGDITYSHQLLGATLVHPHRKEVIPLAPESIVKQDGETKNDCERNATRRFLKRFRQEHPHLPIIVVEDALSSNAPHLDDLRDARMHYIIGVKPGDHAFLFRHIYEADEAGRTQTLTTVDSATGITHHFRWHLGLSLNESHLEHLVNILEYYEIHPTKIVKKTERPGKLQHFCWITDFVPEPDNLYLIMRGGRSRWKIENETFNTMKNQGYPLEHNYGHGEQNLSGVLAMLMMLVFLIDQTQQICCPLFLAAYEKKHRNKRSLWEVIRTLFDSFVFASMQELYEAIVYGRERQKVVRPNTS